MASSYCTDRVSARRDLSNNPRLVFITPCPPPPSTGEHFQPADRLDDSIMFSVHSKPNGQTKPKTLRSQHHPKGAYRTALTHNQPIERKQKDRPKAVSLCSPMVMLIRPKLAR